ncbi:AAA family ATPase [Serinicoccus marinus]|uniref:AAA family ATPase n=1 Tax=Serinicoccus marinus TaxID=247333 RepID=UPI002490FF8A|nr:AAA family ATPase [Serinicoccus marinus]
MSAKKPDARPLARQLMAAGIPVVVVRQEGGKDRYPADWSSSTVARCDLSDYRPGVDALAFVAGHGLDAVDVDTKAGGSLDNLPEFPFFGETRTPSGGGHYLVPSSGLRQIVNVRTKKGPVGDYAGGHPDGTGRRLIYLPGSVRAKYPGKRYAEVEPWDVEGALAAEPDPGLVRVLSACGGPRASEERYVDDSPERDPALGLHPYARAAIEGELDRLRFLAADEWEPGAGWDHHTYEVACNLLEIANSAWSGYTHEAALADLLENAPTDRVWTGSNVREKWESAQRTVDNGGRRPPEDKQADERETVDPASDAFAPLDLVALLDPARPPRRWLWEGLVPTGDSASIVAPGGTGKSLLVLSLCLAAISGQEEFVGRALDFDGRVLYVDMENSEDDWAERLTDLGWTQDTVRPLAGRLIPLSLPPLRGLDTEAGAGQLRGLAEAHQIGAGDLLVLDSTQRVTEGDENSNDTVRALYNHTSSWLKARKVTVLRTDNTGWDTGRERGASSKRDDVGYSLLLKPVDARSGRFSLVNTKHRARGETAALDLVREHDERGVLTWSQAAPQAAAADVDLDFRMPEHMGDTLLVLSLLTDNPAAANYENDLIARAPLLQFVSGAGSELKRLGLELLVEQGYAHKEPIPLANGEPGKTQGYRLTDKGRAWVADADEWGDRLADLAQKTAERRKK